MTISTGMLTSIFDINRTLVLHRAQEFSSQQGNWNELKKSIYIATMVYLSGMGYRNSYELFPGKFKDFSSFMTSFFNFYSLNQPDYIHGGMDYNKAHELIIDYSEFQAIDS
jgi:hypothetical protein